MNEALPYLDNVSLAAYGDRLMITNSEGRYRLEKSHCETDRHPQFVGIHCRVHSLIVSFEI